MAWVITCVRIISCRFTTCWRRAETAATPGPRETRGRCVLLDVCFSAMDQHNPSAFVPIKYRVSRERDASITAPYNHILKCTLHEYSVDNPMMTASTVDILLHSIPLKNNTGIPPHTRTQTRSSSRQRLVCRVHAGPLLVFGYGCRSTWGCVAH